MLRASWAIQPMVTRTRHCSRYLVAHQGDQFLGVVTPLSIGSREGRLVQKLVLGVETMVVCRSFPSNQAKFDHWMLHITD